MENRQKINQERAQYFGWNPKAGVLYFTSDDQGFFTQNSADAHGRALANKNVDAVTREEYLAWAATNTPERIAAAEAGLTAAKEKLQKAQANLAALLAKAAIGTKATANRAVNESAKAVADAEAKLEKLVEKAAAKEEPAKTEQSANSESDGNEPAKEVKLQGPIDVEVTQDDLDRNPVLAEQGVKVGEVVTVEKPLTKEEAERLEAEAANEAAKKEVTTEAPATDAPAKEPATKEPTKGKTTGKKAGTK